MNCSPAAWLWDVDVVSNPEFLKEGDAVKDFMKPDRVIVGTENPRSAEMLKALYAPFARSREKLIIMGVKSAEMTKYAAKLHVGHQDQLHQRGRQHLRARGGGCFRSAPWDGSDHRIGYDFIYPGVGYGGSLFSQGREGLSVHRPPSRIRGRAHRRREPGETRGRSWCWPHKVLRHFEPLGGVAGKTLALWGLAFKANTDDIREAPALAIIRELTAKGMRVRAFDPVAGNAPRPSLPPTRWWSWWPSSTRRWTARTPWPW